MPQKNLAAFYSVALLAAAPVLAKPMPTTFSISPIFTTVSASSPSVKSALAANDLAGGQKMIGKTGAFQGIVTEVYPPEGHPIMILDFASDYKNAMTAFVGPADVPKFAGLSAIVKGKHVLISGKFIAYKGRPEIVLTNPSQVKLIH